MIAIPNMEMPKSCWNCDLLSSCKAMPKNPTADEIGTYTVMRLKDCQLIDIVQCKDCKYFISPYENLIDADGLCDNMQVVMDKTDYCSHGERRE